VNAGGGLFDRQILLKVIHVLCSGWWRQLRLRAECASARHPGTDTDGQVGGDRKAAAVSASADGRRLCRLHLSSNCDQAQSVEIAGICDPVDGAVLLDAAVLNKGGHRTSERVIGPLPRQSLGGDQALPPLS
jgi:hypothetical protein